MVIWPQFWKIDTHNQTPTQFWGKNDPKLGPNFLLTPGMNVYYLDHPEILFVDNAKKLFWNVLIGIEQIFYS